MYGDRKDMILWILLLSVVQCALAHDICFVVPHSTRTGKTSLLHDGHEKTTLDGAFQLGLASRFEEATKKRSTGLCATSKKRNKGVYTRPSAAIERGSGFFVPGLEGPRVRLLFGLVILLLTGVNHVVSSRIGGGMVSSETLAGVFGCLLLLQAGIEFSKDQQQSLDEVEAATPDQPKARTDIGDTSLVQGWSIDTKASSSDFTDAVQWSAASYVALTPATHMMLLTPGRVVYQLGSTEQTQNEASVQEGTNAAFETLQKSTSGRVSLPPTHPVVETLVDENHARSVVLQRIDQERCWLMTSDQLLAAFTSQDLTWLGQLALHVSQQANA